MDDETLNHRVTVRMSDSDIEMIKKIQKDFLPEHNRSQIIRLLLELVSQKYDRLKEERDKWNEAHGYCEFN